MMRKAPPRLATWLLHRLAVGRHCESLEGDLIERYARGRSNLWYWREVAMAIVIARSHASRAWRPRLRITIIKSCLHLLTELTVVLGATTLIDRSRHTQDWHDMLSPTFIATMTVLMAIGLASLWLRLRLLKATRSRRPIRHLAAFFAVAALGGGTLSWASSTSWAGSTHGRCNADACRCPHTESPSITSRGR